MDSFSLAHMIVEKHLNLYELVSPIAPIEIIVCLYCAHPANMLLRD